MEFRRLVPNMAGQSLTVDGTIRFSDKRLDISVDDLGSDTYLGMVPTEDFLVGNSRLQFLSRAERVA